MDFAPRLRTGTLQPVLPSPLTQQQRPPRTFHIQQPAPHHLTPHPVRHRILELAQAIGPCPNLSRWAGPRPGPRSRRFRHCGLAVGRRLDLLEGLPALLGHRALRALRREHTVRRHRDVGGSEDAPTHGFADGRAHPRPAPSQPRCVARLAGHAGHAGPAGSVPVECDRRLSGTFDTTLSQTRDRKHQGLWCGSRPSHSAWNGVSLPSLWPPSAPNSAPALSRMTDLRRHQGRPSRYRRAPSSARTPTRSPRAAFGSARRSRPKTSARTTVW